jgi:DNA gyrase/topoisomerase IV subunit B
MTLTQILTLTYFANLQSMSVNDDNVYYLLKTLYKLRNKKKSS